MLSPVDVLNRKNDDFEREAQFATEVPCIELKKAELNFETEFELKEDKKIKNFDKKNFDKKNFEELDHRELDINRLINNTLKKSSAFY